MTLFTRATGAYSSRAVSTAWVIPPSAYAGADFINSKYVFNGTTAARSALFTADPRTHTNDFMSANWGARTDPAYNNLHPVDYSTAVLGDIGSGGAFPSGWSWISNFGLTTTILANTGGKVRFRIHGTTSSGGNMRLLMGNNGDVTTSVSTLYTISYDVQAIGALVPNLAITKGVRFFTAAVGFISESFPVGQAIRLDGAGPISVSYQATTGATGARIQAEFGILVVPPSTLVDMTFEISNNQVTLGAGKMPRGTTTVPADSLAIATALNTVLTADCAFMAGCRLPPDNTSGTILQLGSSTNRVEVYQSNYVVKVANVVSGVTTTTTLGYVVPWMKTRVAIAKRSGVIYASLNGKAEVACGTAAATLTGVTLGSGTTGAMRGAMAEFAVWNNGQVGTLVNNAKLTGALYDDFDRADGPLGSAVTGQPYMISGTALTNSIVSKKVVITDSGQPTTSCYFTVDMGKAPWLFGGGMSWDNQAGNASAGLITTPNLQGQGAFVSATSEAAAITALANHFLASPSGLFAGQFANNTLNDHAYAFATAATKDGATLDNVVWMMRPSDGALLVRTHTGELIRFADNDYRPYTGRYVVPESYWSVANPAQPKWQVWAAEKS